MKKFQPLLLALLFIFALALAVLLLGQGGYFFVYQVTPSVPKGFYLVVPTKAIKRGDLVVFHPPLVTTNFLEEKKWLPQSGLMMKYVFGVPGDTACTKGDALWLNGEKIALIESFYAPGKNLPRVNFCGRITGAHYLLLSTLKARSFDGRYFGLIGRPNILGQAVPIWVNN